MPQPRTMPLRSIVSKGAAVLKPTTIPKHPAGPKPTTAPKSTAAPKPTATAAPAGESRVYINVPSSASFRGNEKGEILLVTCLDRSLP